MYRLIYAIVRSGLVMAWRLAVSPTVRSPSFLKPTIEGVVRFPSGLGMTTASPPSITATQEFVVPKSIPITLLMVSRTSYCSIIFMLHAYFDHCWTNHFIFQNITFLHFLDNNAFFML